jgi:hypothetical protein
MLLRRMSLVTCYVAFKMRFHVSRIADGSHIKKVLAGLVIQLLVGYILL